MQCFRIRAQFCAPLWCEVLRHNMLNSVGLFIFLQLIHDVQWFTMLKVFKSL